MLVAPIITKPSITYMELNCDKHCKCLGFFQLEERDYLAYKWVCTKRGPEDKGSQGETGMFWRLFNYITGQNETGMHQFLFE